SMYYIFKVPLSLALLLGAIGSATAPASTIMTIRQYKAKGSFVNMILQVVALDDAVALIAFSICAAVVQSMHADQGLNPLVFLLPLFTNLLAIGLGIAFGFLLNRMISERRSDDNRLLLAIATISALAGFCAAFEISPLLSAMALGTSYVNISGNRRLFDQVNDFAPVILTMFFVLSGMRLNVPALATAGVIGIAYFFIRIFGKYLGAFVGAGLSGAAPEIKKYLGLALVPQAGVSIGLAVLGQRILPPELGSLLSTIILSSAVLYEMVGPASGKLALHLSGSIPSPQAEEKEVKVEKTAGNKEVSKVQYQQN
ncbi:MAG TPA: cation:proton antiporter, partial [Firmicutes bacterium]|nr:cation:proton antiporter [Bacillota bacterium]